MSTKQPEADTSSPNDDLQSSKVSGEEKTSQENRNEKSTPPQQTPAVEEKKPTGAGPVPNGGLKAWLQVLGAFMLFFNTW